MLPLLLINSASRRQTPTGPDPEVRGARSRVTRSLTSSGLFTIGLLLFITISDQLPDGLTDRQVKLMLHVARREIMEDEITTVQQADTLKDVRNMMIKVQSVYRYYKRFPSVVKCGEGSVVFSRHTSFSNCSLSFIAFIITHTRAHTCAHTHMHTCIANTLFQHIRNDLSRFIR